MEATEPRRVKVYELDGGQWVDKGTGYCCGEVGEGGAYLVVQNEKDSNSLILNSRVSGCIQYQKQQDTLIVWTELGRNDLALSFQEAQGCKIVCDFLVAVRQQKIAPDISLVAVINTADGEVHEPISAPLVPPVLPPTLEQLAQVQDSLAQAVNSPSQSTRESMAAFVLEHEYVALLQPLLHEAETQHRLEALHALCCSVKRLIQLNDSTILEQLMSDEHIFFTVGALEYDPEYPRMKANHRAYLRDESRFKQVVPIPDPVICDRIRQTFRIQFLKDVVLARLLDDQTFTILTNMIYFAQTEIIAWISAEDGYLEELFGLFEDEDQPAEEPLVDEPVEEDVQTSILEQEEPEGGTEGGDRAAGIVPTASLGLDIPSSSSQAQSSAAESSAAHSSSASSQVAQSSITTVSKDRPSTAKLQEAVRFVHQCSLTSKNLQNQQRSLLFSQFVRHGLFKLVDFALKDDSILIRSLGTELVVTLVDHDAALVRSHVSHPSVHVILINLLLSERDAGLRTQAVETLKALFDPDAGDKSDEYVRHIYEESAGQRSPAYRLFQPLMHAKDDYLLYEYLADMLSFCSASHGVTGRGFFINHKVWVAMSQLVLAPHKQIQLAAIRCLKQCLLGGDEVLVRHLIENKLFGPILTLLLSLGNRNNLIHSACLDFLHIVRMGVSKHDSIMGEVLAHLVENYTRELQQLSYTGVAACLLEKSVNPVLSDDTEAGLSPKREAEKAHPNQICLYRSTGAPKRRLVARDPREQREAQEEVARRFSVKKVLGLGKKETAELE